MDIQRVVLVGFMGAGKSAVGRTLARRLGWGFIDVDTVVEGKYGRSVPEVFRHDGEAAFRRAEAEAASEALEETQVVLATGGGWAARPGRLEMLPEGTLSIWLEVSASEAARRVEEDAVGRPLLDGPDRVERAAQLLADRTPFYRLADARVDTEGRSVDDVTTRIQEILTEHESENRR